MSSAKTHRNFTTKICQASQTSVFAINYRLAPDYPFRLALHDALSAYFHLIHHGLDGINYNPKDIILAGDSAGAGLCTSLALYLRDHGYESPGGMVLMAPWVKYLYIA